MWRSRLLDLLTEMVELKDAAPVTPDWCDAAAVREQLKLRRALNTPSSTTPRWFEFCWERKSEGIEGTCLSVRRRRCSCVVPDVS